MSILYCEGFEQYASAEDFIETYPTAQTSLTLVTDTALGRGSAVRSITGINGGFNTAIPPQPVNSVIGFACRFRLTSLPAGSDRRWIVSLYEGITFHVGAQIAADGTLFFQSGAGIPNQYTTAPLQLNRWYHFEGKFKVDNVEGLVEIRLDGKTILYGTGDTRNSGGLGTVNAIRWGRCVADSAGGMDLDDVVIWNGDGTVNNDFLGDVEVQTIKPTADDVVTGWTPNTGTAWQAVSETGEDTDTSYIACSTLATPASFELSDLLTTPTNVLAVSMFALARKDDAGDRSIQIGVDSGGVVAESDVSPLGLNYGSTSFVLNKNPNGDTAWTVAAVNGLKGRVTVAV